jgi:hypothetical protein
MAKKFLLVDQFLGYSNKADVTNVDPRYLVPPSKDVLVNAKEKVSVRGGYSVDGTSSTAETPVISSYDWTTSKGTERNLKHYGTALYYRYKTSAGVVSWRDLGLVLGAGAELEFTEVYRSTEAKDLLLFVDGLNANQYMWSGGVTTVASGTLNTITKQGTTTWAEERFLLTGTRSVVINGTTYTYTGGEGTTTLTGVAPSAAGLVAGDIAHQSVVTTANTPASGIKNSIISTLKNQVYMADKTLSSVYVSKNTSHTDFTFTSPVRLPGEGALLTLDGPATAFAPQEEEMYISAGKSFWFRTKFTLSADLTKEELKVERLKSGYGGGAVSQGPIAYVKNSVIFFNNNREVMTLGRVENINTPDAKDISDRIQTECDNLNLTIKQHALFDNNKAYFLFPSDSKMLIYDFEYELWQPPQTIPGRRLCRIEGNVGFHSSESPNTYLFDSSTTDNGNPIVPVAAFAYRSYGRRDWNKKHDEWFQEGFIKPNTNLKVQLNYDFGGFTQIINRTISGSNDKILFASQDDASIGKAPLGSEPFGGIRNASDSCCRKFRAIVTMDPTKYYELQPIYSSTELDEYWELISQGGNVILSDKENTEIKITDN